MTASARLPLARLARWGCHAVGMLAVGILAVVGARADSVGASQPPGCPVLLTEIECRVYHEERRLARSTQEKARFEAKYATLLRERSSLCPPQAGAPEPAGTIPVSPNPVHRPLAGRKISM